MGWAVADVGGQRDGLDEVAAVDLDRGKPMQAQLLDGVVELARPGRARRLRDEGVLVEGDLGGMAAVDDVLALLRHPAWPCCGSQSEAKK